MRGLTVCITVVLCASLIASCVPADTDSISSPDLPSASDDRLAAAEDRLAQLTERLDRLEQLETAHQRLITNRRGRLDLSGGCTGILVTVYLWDQLYGPDRLQPVEMLSAGDDRLTAAVNAWLAGAPDVGLDNGLGSHPRLLSVYLDSETAVLDFDARFLDFPGGSGWAQAVLVSLTYTVTEIEGVRGVRVLVEGQPAVMHGWVWTEPEDRNSVKTPFRLEELIRYDGPGRPRTR